MKTRYSLTGGAIEMGRALGVLMDNGVELIEVIHRSDGRYTASWEDEGNGIQRIRDQARKDEIRQE